MSKNILLQKVAKNFSVLFVEDDLELCKNTVEVLENFFQNISIAHNGLDGLSAYVDYFEKNKRYVDIIFTDIQMPHMNGIELSKEVLKINKKQKIIIMSAYTDKKYLIELINIGVKGFIQKPFYNDKNLNIIYDMCILQR